MMELMRLPRGGGVGFIFISIYNKERDKSYLQGSNVLVQWVNMFLLCSIFRHKRRRDRDVKDERCYVRHSQWIINDVNIVMWIERRIEKKFYITSKK